MIKHIRDTLESIGKLSQSSAGYLLKFDSLRNEVLSSFGGSKDNLISLNELLLKLQNSGKSISEEIKDSTSYKELARLHSCCSVFVKELFSGRNNGNSYFMLLFSKDKNNFSEQILSPVTPMIDDLSDLVRNYDGNLQSILTTKPSKLNQASPYYDQLLRSFFEASEDLVFVLDIEGCFINVNEYGAACLDYEVSELLGSHLIELVASRNKSVLAKSFQKILEEDKLVTFEAVLLSKFGNEIIFQLNCKSIRNDENVIGVIGVGKNITELRNYEEKIHDLNLRLIEANRIVSVERQRSKRQKAILTELNRMKSEFISNISHELRTPLASIIGFSETISSDPNMPDEMKMEFNNIILNEGKRLAKLINDVLDISRLEGGQIALTKSEFDIVKLIEEAISVNQKLIEEKEIILRKELPSEAVVLNADKEKIFRVFTSLINNASKYTPLKGRIVIAAQSLYKEFEVTISDTGIGIPEKDLPFIFQKFYRINRPGSEVSGTGLGLVFVKQIVDLHKGFITIQSEINKGTTVILKLPKDSKANIN